MNGNDDSATPGGPAFADGIRGSGQATTHLVLGHDQHPNSQVALAFAEALAMRLDATLHIVHIIDIDDYPIDAEAGDWEASVAASVAAEEATVRQALSGSLATWDFTTRQGGPVAVLTSTAEHFDALMIIIGEGSGHTHAVISRLLGGHHVADGLLNHGQRPVLIVPDTHNKSVDR